MAPNMDPKERHERDPASPGRASPASPERGTRRRRGLEKVARGRNTTADRTADVLTLFDEQRPVLSAAEVSRRLGMTRSTTYRYLQTLRSYGLVEEDEGRGGFRLGPRIYQLARVARQGLGLPEIALPVMREIREATGEVVLLTRRWGDTVVCVERVEGTHPVRLSYDRGQAHGVHAGASAKILLAYATPDEIDAVLQNVALTRYTEKTVVDPSAIRAELRTIQEQGYAVTDSEVDEGVRGVAAPVFRSDGRIAAGLSVAAPTFRLDDAALPTVLKAVREGAAAVTARLRDLDS